MKLKILFRASTYLFFGVLYSHLSFSQSPSVVQGGTSENSQNGVFSTFPQQPGGGMGFSNQHDPNAVYAGALDYCPFNPPKSSDVNSLMSALTSSLVALKNQCPNLNDTISAIEKGINETTNQFNILLTQKSPIDPQSSSGLLPNPDITQVTLSCSNYKLLLAREYDILQDRLDQSGTENIPSRYLNCFGSGSNSSGKKKCISRSYNQSLSQISRNCSATYFTKVDESLKKSLNSISEGFTSVLNSNSSCGGNYSSLVAEVGIKLAEALTVLPGTLGWAGAAINFFANIISSFIKKSNYDDSPVAALEMIAASKKSKALMCLWFQFQNKKLRCHEFFKNPSTTNSSDTALCSSYFSGPLPTEQHTNIKILQDQLERISKKPFTPEKIDEFNSLLSSTIPDPLTEGKEITLETHLNDIATVLRDSNNPRTKRADMALGVGLGDLLKLQKSLSDPKFTAKNPNYMNDLKKLNEAINNSINSFSMEKAVDAYWRVKGKEDPYLYIKNLSTLDPTNTDHNGSLSYNGHESDIMLGSNAMIKYFQELFNNNIALLGESYHAAVAETDKNRVYTSAIELAKVCFLSAGIYYAKAPESQRDLFTKDALNRINEAPTKKYEEACKVFSCLNQNNDNKIGSLFKPKSSGNEASKEFRTYQCQNLKNYDIILNKIKSQVSAKGKLCD